ncbi:unnamed protein product [Paramecium octaurelia]|uniref:Uncharacterized protein n=1 Tax=Paramecium octaurelia TaxID=43137 RepID=A0A8S1TUZ3_PAROT|nr:unnamed protein product [Paramecium octaurelia]
MIDTGKTNKYLHSPVEIFKLSNDPLNHLHILNQECSYIVPICIIVCVLIYVSSV